MQAYRPAASIALLVSALLAACLDEASAQPPARAEPGVALYHRFTLPAGAAWGDVAVSLQPHAWRVGSVDGPAATEADLRAALGRLGGIEIGGRCAGWVEGSTDYPCGFAVGEIDLAGMIGSRYSSIGYDRQGPSQQTRQTRLPGTDTPAFRASGLLAPVPDAMRFASVRAPLRYLGQRGAAFGARLAFRIRAVSNPLVPSQFDRGSGLVILRGSGDVTDAEAPAGPQRAGHAGANPAQS